MRRLIPLVLASVLLVACGGGGDGDSSFSNDAGGGDGGSGDFCAAANQFAALNSVINEATQPDDLEAQLAPIESALSDLENSAPKEIRDDVKDVVEAYGQIVKFITESDPSDPEAMMGEMFAIGFSIAEPAERMNQYILTECGLDLEAVAATAPTNIDGGAGDFEPGPVAVEVVNLDANNGPVDVYATTTNGMVNEYEIVNPPMPGYVVVVPAGTTTIDSYSEVNLASEYVSEDDTYGPRRLILLHPDLSSFADVEGGPTSTTYWFDAEDDTWSNALKDAVPGQHVVTVANLTGASLNAALPGAGACLTTSDSTQEGLLIGGTTALPFSFAPGPIDIGLHDYDAGDYDCLLSAVASWSGQGTDGGRTLVVVYADEAGSPVVWSIDF
jgi:hypothetical protein